MIHHHLTVSLLTFAVVALPAALYKVLKKTFASWLIYSGFSVMLIYLASYLYGVFNLARVGFGLPEIIFSGLVSWNINFFLGSLALFAALRVCLQWLRGFGGIDSVEGRRLLGIQILLFGLFPCLVNAIPDFVYEIYSVLGLIAIPLTVMVGIILLISPHGGKYNLHYNPIHDTYEIYD